MSFEKQTSTLGRALGASEWALSGGCVDAGLLDLGCVELSDTIGEQNSTQLLTCSELFCGDGIVTGTEQCDEGPNNSNAPDATCRTDCRFRRCGDGIVDPNAPAGFPEACERDADCALGESCFACQCVTGTPLGSLSFSVVPGPGESDPPDDGESTILRVDDFSGLGFTNGSQGDWSPGPLVFTAGVPGADGRAPFLLTEPTIIGATLPAVAGLGKVCYRITQDPEQLGWIDCDGGSNADADLVVDSGGAGPNGPPMLTVGAGGVDSGPGAAVAYVILEAAATSDATTPCEEADFTAGTSTRTALTTARSTATILNALQGGTSSVAHAGQPFDCGAWVEDGGASITAPSVALDVEVPVLGPKDIAQALRLNDD